MLLDVSVVVPVYNPGANLEPCLRSLLDQTLAADRYEIVLVDDGSTDGTGALLDDYARRHPDRVRVFHEPNSGWPGRPRNVGVREARGDYVQFVDNDDLLGARALERMVDAARACAADVVLGKMSSDFRGINHDVYRDDRQGVTLADFPLLESLTPHKMFRRRFLLDHGIRFAEGPLHLEDQLFCMHAYLHASSAAVVADEQCYFYKRRSGFGRNAGDVAAEPEDYYRDLERVLDVIDVHVAPRDRPRLYERFFRVEMLGRLRDQAMLDYESAYRRALFNRVRRLAEERVPPQVDDLLPHFPRRQARLLRTRDLDGMLGLAAEIAALRVDARLRSVRWQEGRLALDVAVELTTPVDVPVDADVVLVARDDASTWFVPGRLRFPGRQRHDATVLVDPAKGMQGRPLRPGLWDLRLRTHIGGLTRTTRLNRDESVGAPLPLCVYDEQPHSVAAYWTAAGGLALDVDQWAHSLTAHVAANATAAGPGAWSVTGVAGATATARLADVFCEGRRVAARLTVDPAGARLEAAGAAGDDIWVRIGPPGSAAPDRIR